MIGIIGAMDMEVAQLRSRMTDTVSETISGIEFTRGTLEGQPAVVARCGVGKVFAALCAQTMILKYTPDCIINTGVGGTLSPELSIGDVAVSSTVVQYDMDTSPLGDPVGLVSGINIIHFPANETLRQSAVAVLTDMGLNHRIGTIATGDRFLCDPVVKAQLNRDFGAIACEMEGGAIAHVCYVNDVPFLILRAISDGADDQSNMDFPTFARMAAEHSADALAAMLRRM